MKKTALILLALLILTGFAAAETEVPVQSVDATSWIVGKDPGAYTPQRMIDGDAATSFQFSVKTTPLGQEYVYFYFRDPADIGTLWIKNGFWRITSGLDQYTRNCRVKSMTVDFQYAGTNGFADPVQVQLPDDTARRDWTRVDLGPHEGVTAVRFLIREIYKGSKFPNDVCISEVKFFAADTGTGQSAPGTGSSDDGTGRGAPGTGTASDSSAGVSSPSGGADWSRLYEDLVMNARYLSYGQEYDTSTTGDMAVAFCLHDMDGDGVPEIIISNGVDYMAGRTNYVYGIRNGRIVYLGNAGFRDSILMCWPGSNYPGLTCFDGNMGYYDLYYYTVNDREVIYSPVYTEQYVTDDDPYTWLDEPIIKKNTADQALFDLTRSGAGAEEIKMFTLSDIMACGGWQAFVDAVFGGAAANEDWRTAYRAFTASGEYRDYIQPVDPLFNDTFADRDEYGVWENFSLGDIDLDGTPELIVTSIYGLEQADVFTFTGGQVRHLGVMGGDNFFQIMFSYEGRPCLYAAMGGPAMTIDAYTVENGALIRAAAARTEVNADGDDTVGITMYTDDDALRRLLEGTFLGKGTDEAVIMPIYSLEELPL